MQTVGFVGVGIMGKPMAKNLIKAGYNLIVHRHINPRPAEELRKEGAEVTTSVLHIAEECSVVITMLPNSQESEDVIIGENGIIKRAKKAGLSPTSVYNAIKGGSAGSKVLDNKALPMIKRDFKPGFKIKLHQKDLQNVLNAGSSLNIPLPLSAQLLEMLKSLTSAGNGELDHSAIIKFYENICGVDIVE